MSLDEPYYAKGLRFECTRCNACCRHDPGYVFLSQKDLDRLSAHFKITNNEFRKKYCRIVDFGITTRLCLTEKANFDCILWEGNGCSAYTARPLQCRSFPFWVQNVETREAWESTAQDCPGIHRGKLHTREEIDSWLQVRLAEPQLEK